jgi:hypothetical protein
MLSRILDVLVIQIMVMEFPLASSGDERNSSVANRREKHQALIPVSYERKKAWEVDDHTTKAKYCHYTLV